MVWRGRLLELGGVLMPKNAAMWERFWEKVAIGDDEDCWEWTASRDRDGYGRFQEPGPNGQRSIRAHRWYYEAAVGPIRAGYVVMHSCDNPPCVNPRHLRLGTPLENNDDKVAKGRHARVWGSAIARSTQTHCKNGHPLSGANLVVNVNGFRVCRACRNERARLRYHEVGHAPRPVLECIDCHQLRPHRAHGRCATCDQAWRRSNRGGDALWGLVS